MALKTPQQYFDTLRDGRVVYCGGKSVEGVTKHPIFNITNNWVAMDYVMGEDDGDYAVAFAVPVNSPGITMISTQPQASFTWSSRCFTLLAKFRNEQCLGKLPQNLHYMTDFRH